MKVMHYKKSLKFKKVQMIQDMYDWTRRPLTILPTMPSFCVYQWLIFSHEFFHHFYNIIITIWFILYFNNNIVQPFFREFINAKITLFVVYICRYSNILLQVDIMYIVQIHVNRATWIKRVFPIKIDSVFFFIEAKIFCRIVVI